MPGFLLAPDAGRVQLGVPGERALPPGVAACMPGFLLAPGAGRVQLGVPTERLLKSGVAARN